MILTELDRVEPAVWTRIPHLTKARVLNALREHESAVRMYDNIGIPEWDRLSHNARIITVRHLVSIGRLRVLGARARDSSQVSEKLNADVQRLRDGISVTNEQLYPPPNGGKRILPSVYGSLTDQWMRSNGPLLDPEIMNSGHLENTLRLLKESHGNVLDKSADVLGRMHNHFCNQPEIQYRIVDLFNAIQAVEVDEMYPIFEVLAEELNKRCPHPRHDVGTSDFVQGQLDLSNWS